MTSLLALQQRIGHMLEQLQPRTLPKEWEIVVEEGQEVPAHILAQIGSDDSVLIREIPRGYLGDEMNLPEGVAWYNVQGLFWLSR
jgi:hypothetical protein